MTVTDLLNTMSSAEFTQWVGYFTVKSEEAEEARERAKVRR